MGEKMTLEDVRTLIKTAFRDSQIGMPVSLTHSEADSILRAIDAHLATPAQTVDVEFDEGDLFWPDDDGEQCADSLFNLLEDMHANGQIDSGEVIRVRRARNLPPIEVTITTFENGDFCDYKLSQAIGDKT